MRTKPVYRLTGADVKSGSVQFCKKSMKQCIVNLFDKIINEFC